MLSQQHKDLVERYKYETESEENGLENGLMKLLEDPQLIIPNFYKFVQEQSNDDSSTLILSIEDTYAPCMVSFHLIERITQIIEKRPVEIFFNLHSEDKDRYNKIVQFLFSDELNNQNQKDLAKAIIDLIVSKQFYFGSWKKISNLNLDSPTNDDEFEKTLIKIKTSLELFNKTYFKAAPVNKGKKPSWLSEISSIQDPKDNVDNDEYYQNSFKF